MLLNKGLIKGHYIEPNKAFFFSDSHYWGAQGSGLSVVFRGSCGLNDGLCG